ncbi:glycosyltransferase [Neobacillus sp. C211]|uniref:glycosyltransferase n=1 Tax=unclassified Neobacillus TaxID=2675272 RepID=UPI0039786F1B
MYKDNILMVLDSFDIGGTETHVLSLVEEMVSRNLKVIVIGKNGLVKKSFLDLGCKVFEVNYPNHNNEQQLAEFSTMVREMIINEKINIIHAHQTPSAYLIFSIAKDLNIPTVFTVHGTYYPIEQLTEVLNLTSKIISVSYPVHNYIQNNTSLNSFIIPNGINTQKYTFRTITNLRNELNIPPNTTILMYASRLTWAKGKIGLTLLRACKKLKLRGFDIHVVIVGKGPYFKKIKKLADKIHVLCQSKFIHILGERQDMETLLSSADCVIGTGRVALEAMSCGKPVIAVGNHGYFGVIDKDHYEEAWKCYFGDHGSISKRSRLIFFRDISKLISKKKDFLHKMGVDSREWVETEFNIKDMTNRTLEIYESCKRE